MNLKKPLTEQKSLIDKSVISIETRNLKPKWKLNDVERDFLCKLLGHGYSGNETRDEMKRVFGIELDTQTVQGYRYLDKWKPVIKKYRDEYVADMDNIPTFHKKIRMSRHERAYNMAYKQQDPKSMIQATEHSRVEVEGGSNSVSSLTLISNRYYNMSDEELVARENQLLEEVYQRRKNGKNGIRRVKSEVGGAGTPEGAKDV